MSAPTTPAPRIALFEARLASELAELVRRYGGEPVVAPAVRETPHAAPRETQAFIEALAREPEAVIVFLTGAGVAEFREPAGHKPGPFLQDPATLAPVAQ